MPDLPDDIIFKILSKLTVKSLLRFRCVCKAWCELFRNPSFVKMHLDHANEINNFAIMLHNNNVSSGTHVYTIDYDLSSSTCDEAIEIDYPSSTSGDKIVIWGSCNGLLFCIVSGVDKFMSLWNPSTKEYKEVPDVPFELSDVMDYDDIDSKYFEYGFDYDCKIEDYKVVRLVGFYEEYFCEVTVYTLGTNSWRRIENIPYVISTENIPEWSRGTVNGTRHWLATSYLGSKASNVILSFNVADERFQEMALPNCLESMDEILENYVGVLGGDLCLVDDLSKDYLDIWVMKDYGVVESWTKLVRIDPQTLVGSVRFYMPIQSFKNGEILLVQNGLDGKALVLFDQEHKTARTLKACDDLKKWTIVDTCTYVGSLVSLNLGIYAEN